MINKDNIKDIFDYKDGQLIWKIRPHNRVTIGSKAGTVSQAGYCQIQYKNKIYLRHRLVFLLHNGFLPENVDHIDGNPANDSIENLRGCTHQENMLNQKKRKGSSNPSKGVHTLPSGNYRVQLRINGKTRHIGTFDNLELAELVASEARELHHSEFARHV